MRRSGRSLRRRYGHLRTVGTHTSHGVSLSLRTAPGGYIVRGESPWGPVREFTRRRSSGEQIIAAYQLAAIGDITHRTLKDAVANIVLFEDE